MKLYDVNLEMRRKIKYLLDRIMLYLTYFIVIELVLGGSGRLIVVGNFLTLRYILFIFSMVSFLLYCVLNGFKIYMNKFYSYILFFFFVYTASITLGIYSGFLIPNIARSAQGYLYLLIYFPLAQILTSVEYTKKIITIFINSTVFLAIITIILFVKYYFDHNFYIFIEPVLRSLNYGYIALRGGLPAVFLKTSPLMSVSFILVLLNFINVGKQRTIRTFIKLVILMFGIISTMSMGIWLATFFSVILVIYISKGKFKINGIIVVSILSIMILLILKDYVLISIANRLNSTDSSYIVKLDQLVNLINIWLENAVFGKGFGFEVMFSTALGSRTMVNFELFWIQLLVNMGLIGFASYLSIFAKSFHLTVLISKKIPHSESLNLKGLMIGLFSLMVISSVNPFLNNPIGIGYLILVMLTINSYYNNYALKNTILEVK